MLNAFFTVSPLTGDVLSTNFSVTNLTSGASVARYIWDQGIRLDNNVLKVASPPTSQILYDEFSPNFVYNLPGIYTISLTAIDFDNQFSSFSQTITANFAYRDYIRFTRIPTTYADPGRLTETPFELEVLTTNIEKPIIIDLFAVNSNSTPQQFIPEKWLPISPTWKFLDKNLNVTSSLSVIPVPIYKNNVVVAVSGTCEFYYVDSTSTGNPTENCPILITATLQTSGYVNPEDSNIFPYESYANNLGVRTGLVWQVNDLLPNTLKVTGNYIDNINSKQWENIKVPFLVTCHSNRSLLLSGSKNDLSEVIFSYPASNTLGKLTPVSATLTNYNNNQYTVDEAPLLFQTTDNANFKAGGYIFTTITPNTTAANTSIEVQTIANFPTKDSNQFTYPGPYAPSPSVWVSNPNLNTLNKITLVPDTYTCKTINFLRDTGTLTDGYIKECSVPRKETSSTFNYEMSGFSGIYGMAVDPRNYDVIAADAELDRLYRFSSTGKLLKTLELSSLLDYESHQKMFASWYWYSPNPLLSSTIFSLYSPNLVTPDLLTGDGIQTYNFANYITLVGGVMQPCDNITFDPKQRTFVLLVSPNYPPDNQRIDLIQIFNPLLRNYISTLQHWTTASLFNETVFPLVDAPSLSSDSNFYIVSVDGILQRPESYSISNTNKTITFNNQVPKKATVYVVYIPSISLPASWNYTFPTPTTSINLSGNPLYKLDDKSVFVVNMGGVFQAPTNFTHNVTAQQLLFSTPIPANTHLHIRQISVPESVYVPAAYTPAYVSLDSESNIWVSLFNTVSVLKFDPNFNLLFSAVPTSLKWPVRSWTNPPPHDIGYQAAAFSYQTRYVEPSSSGVDIYHNEFFLKPPAAETDQNDNCWVTYSHPLCSMLVKYSSTGEPLLQIPTGPYTSPTYIAVNKQNNCWISNNHGSSYTYTSLSGSLQLYDSTTGNVLRTVTGFSRPSHLALDKTNNLWFTHSVNRIGYFNTSTATLSMWTLSSNGFTQFVYPSSYADEVLRLHDNEENEENDEMGGLAVDIYNRVWVLDSLRNFAWVLTATPNFLELPIRSFKIRPDSTLGYYIDLQTGETFTESKEGYYYRSAQATGDWTGNRWYQKYLDDSKITTIPLSGVSNSFSVEKFTNKHQIRRINESFNSAEYFKSLALPENLKENPYFFNQFLGSVIGTGALSTYEDIGQKVYERIANFTINHADIDTCNVDQLLSLAEQVAVIAEDYGALYPTDIKNMLDIASVPRSKLWGLKDNVPLTPQSLGEKYNTQTDYLTAGTKIYLRDKYSPQFSLITVPVENNQLIYPLSSFNGYGFNQPVLANYIVYRFDPVYTNSYIENIIDWESPYTTQNPNLSTTTDWYGNEGAVETAFRYLLTKNLFPK